MVFVNLVWVIVEVPLIFYVKLYVGESNEIAHLLDSQIATNTSPNIKKKFAPEKPNFHSFLKRYITLL